jgi:hypothetical protein
MVRQNFLPHISLSILAIVDRPPFGGALGNVVLGRLVQRQVRHGIAYFEPSTSILARILIADALTYITHAMRLWPGICDVLRLLTDVLHKPRRVA